MQTLRNGISCWLSFLFTLGGYEKLYCLAEWIKVWPDGSSFLSICSSSAQASVWNLAFVLANVLLISWSSTHWKKNTFFFPSPLSFIELLIKEIRFQADSQTLLFSISGTIGYGIVLRLCLFIFSCFHNPFGYGTWLYLKLVRSRFRLDRNGILNNKSNARCYICFRVESIFKWLPSDSSDVLVCLIQFFPPRHWIAASCCCRH